jgi:thioredoxin-related protein
MTIFFGMFELFLSTVTSHYNGPAHGRKTTMKQAVAWLLAIVAWGSGLSLAEQGVPYARDFQKDAQAAREKNGVVLVVFSGAHCSYCETVLNEFLIPMSGNSDYQSKVVMRKVETSSTLELKDFQGRKIAHRKFAGDNGVRMVPTVMIFDSDGKLLAKPVVGLTTVDYYGQFLDQAIDQGLEKIRRIPLGHLMSQ